MQSSCAPDPTDLPSISPYSGVPGAHDVNERAFIIETAYRLPSPFQNKMSRRKAIVVPAETVQAVSLRSDDGRAAGLPDHATKAQKMNDVAVVGGPLGESSESAE